MCWYVVPSALLVLSLALVACETPMRTTQLENMNEGRQTYDYSDTADRDPTPDTLLIVTASGGGTRAAAFVLGALQGLGAVIKPDGGNLLDDVDIISSVSGGSVTSAYFALEGQEGFTHLKENFLKKHGFWEILGRAANPVTLARVTSSNSALCKKCGNLGSRESTRRCASRI